MKHDTKHPWMKGIEVCSNEDPRPFPRGDDKEIEKRTHYIKIYKFNNLLLQNHWVNLNEIWHKESLCEGNSSLFK